VSLTENSEKVLNDYEQLIFSSLQHRFTP